MNSPKILTALGLGFLAAATAQAETLVQYLFTANNTSTSRNATTTGSNVTPEAFANGAGVTISSSSLGNPTARSYYVNGNQVEQDISATSTDWLGFTINANAGHTMNLENLSFAYAYSYNEGEAPTTPATFAVRSSVDNYATSIAVLTANVPGMAVSVTWSDASVVLTDPAYQNLDTISFRIFLNDGANQNPSSFLRIDTVTLTGLAAAPIPEPAGFGAVMALGGLAWAGLRRKPRAASGTR